MSKRVYTLAECHPIAFWTIFGLFQGMIVGVLTAFRDGFHGGRTVLGGSLGGAVTIWAAGQISGFWYRPRRNPRWMAVLFWGSIMGAEPRHASLAVVLFACGILGISMGYFFRWIDSYLPLDDGRAKRRLDTDQGWDQTLV